MIGQMGKSKSTVILYDSKTIQGRIYPIHGIQVMHDSDLAEFYRVETKQLNRTVKRNIDRSKKNLCSD